MVRTTLAAGFLLTLGMAASGADLVANPSFEADGSAIQGVGYVRQGNEITGWQASADGECARVPVGVAFFDNGVCPDGAVVAVLQNRSVLRQEVGPFEPGRVYRLRLSANGRATDLPTYGRSGTLEVRLNGTLLVGPVPLQPVEALGQFTRPFQVFETTFSSGGGRLPLELHQTDPGEGISVLVDDVRIEPAETAAGTPVVAVNRARIRLYGEAIPAADFRQAQWLWSKEDSDPLQAAPVGERYFRRTFTVADQAAVRRALFIGTADNHGEVFVNGTHLGTLAGFSEWYEIDFTGELRRGRNVVAVQAVNTGDLPNPAGWAGMILLLDGEGKAIQALPSSADWRCARTPVAGWQEPAGDDSGWEKAVAIGPLGCSPWGDFGFMTWLVPTDFTEFGVPGQERYMTLLRQLFWLHYAPSGPLATMWDGWMSMSSLWPATGPAPGTNTRRERWRQALLERRIDSEGYVSTHQHHGFGHGEGWPFPTYAQAQSVGWVFQTTHLAYRMPWTGDVADWALQGLTSESLAKDSGWRLRVTAATASLLTPSFDIDSFVAPLLRLEWDAQFPATASARLEWATAAEPEFSAARSLPVRLAADVPGGMYTHVALYRHPGWAGRLNRFRLTFQGAAGASFRLLTLCAVPDTRHTINNPCYLQGCTEYVNWTGDIGFLRENLARMRTALGYALREFRVEAEGCVFAPWIGHDGTSGIGRAADGSRLVHYGRGIGSNYWDLLPFSGRDCLATIYLYDALRRMAALETGIARHPEWGLAAPPPELAAQRLDELAARLAREGQGRFWNPETGRFVACVDSTGEAHDYGYTFVNNEALYYGFGSAEQARSILDWTSGRRLVAGDTSSGDDIYHFRFGPRATTRRNTEWYTYPWPAPESIPWGGQVQDGGAVLGFAFHDQMARLRYAGPDDAWQALKRTLDWFADVQAAGGYRAYYAVPGRGTLQGGGPPGGLGMDREFFESVLVPQIMLYGFLGFQAEPEGFRLDPRLPSDWPSLQINRIHCRDAVLNIQARRDRIDISSVGSADVKVRLRLPVGWRVPGTPSDADGGTLVTLGRDRSVVCEPAP